MVDRLIHIINISGQTWQSNWLGRKLGYPYKFNCWSSLSSWFNSIFGIQESVERIPLPQFVQPFDLRTWRQLYIMWLGNSDIVAPTGSPSWLLLGNSGSLNRRSLLSPRISNQDLSPEMVAQKWGQPYAVAIRRSRFEEVPGYVPWTKLAMDS